MRYRPFRAPHHTISEVALVGGGSIPRPGEISLAHNGVLFLDELPEFDRRALEALRQPLEEGRVTITRTARTSTFPARFMLVAAMNPCPCGFRGDQRRACRCSEPQIERYAGRISGPLRDRIDLVVEVPAIGATTLANDQEPSAAIRDRVDNARARQRRALWRTETEQAARRRRAENALCARFEERRALLDAAVQRFFLSSRGCDRVLRVSRTIADLAGNDRIAAASCCERPSSTGSSSPDLRFKLNLWFRRGR